MFRIIRYLFSILIFGGLVYYVYLNREAVSMAEVARHKTAVGVSLFTLATTFLAGGFGWMLILKKMDINVPAGEAVRVWILSQLGKYVPGKIWIVVSRLYLLSGRGNKIELGYSMLLELVLINVTGLFVFLCTVALWDRTIPGFGKIFIWLPFLLPLCVALLHPVPLKKTVNKLLGWMGKETIEIRLRFSQILNLVLYYIFFWGLYGIAFGVLASAFTDVTIRTLVVFAGMYIFSFIVGFISLLTPGGLGVREGVLALLLSTYMEPSDAVYLSLASRIWFTVVEFGMVLFFMLWRRDEPLKRFALKNE